MQETVNRQHDVRDDEQPADDAQSSSRWTLFYFNFLPGYAKRVPAGQPFLHASKRERKLRPFSSALCTKADNNIENNIDSVTRMVRNTRLPGFKRGGCRGTSCMYCSPFRAVKLLLLFSIPTVVVNHNAPKIQVGVASIVVTTNIRSSWIPQCPHNGII